MDGFWKNIPDFPGYQINADGQVRSFKRKGNEKLNATPILIASKRAGLGKKYKGIDLYRNGKGYTRFIHRLVYLAFLGDIPEGLNIDHIDNFKYYISHIIFMSEKTQEPEFINIPVKSIDEEREKAYKFTFEGKSFWAPKSK